MLVWICPLICRFSGDSVLILGGLLLQVCRALQPGSRRFARSSLFLLVDDGRAICFVLVKIFGIVSCDLCICVGRWHEALLVVFGFALLARGKLVGFLSFRPRGYVVRCRWQVVAVCAHLCRCAF